MNSLKSLTDEELVAVVVDEDQSAYAILVHRYEKALTRYVCSMLGDPADAADAVQETFIKAFINLRGFDQKKKLSSWLYRIAHNEAIDHIRKNKKTTNMDEDVLALVADESESNLSILERKELAGKVREHISELPLKFRGVIALYFLEEKSYEEISYVLQMPMGTVATQLNRGKKLLAATLRREAEIINAK